MEVDVIMKIRKYQLVLLAIMMIMFLCGCRDKSNQISDSTANTFAVLDSTESQEITSTAHDETITVPTTEVIVETATEAVTEATSETTIPVATKSNKHTNTQNEDKTNTSTNSNNSHDNEIVITPTPVETPEGTRSEWVQDENETER